MTSSPEVFDASAQDLADPAALMQFWGDPAGAPPWPSERLVIAGIGSYPVGRQPGIEPSILDETIPAVSLDTPFCAQATPSQIQGRVALLCGFAVGLHRWRAPEPSSPPAMMDPLPTHGQLRWVSAGDHDTLGCYVPSDCTDPVALAARVPRGLFERHSYASAMFLARDGDEGAQPCYPAPTAFDQAVNCVLINTLSCRRGLAEAMTLLPPALTELLLHLGDEVAPRLGVGGNAADPHRALAAIARQHLADLICRYPVLLHPRMLYMAMGVRHGRQLASCSRLVPMMMASEGLTLPCRRLGFSDQQLTAFSTNPWVVHGLCSSTLTRPATGLASPGFLSSTLPALPAADLHASGQMNQMTPAFALLSSLIELDRMATPGPLGPRLARSLYSAAGALPHSHSGLDRATAFDSLMSMPHTSLMGSSAAPSPPNARQSPSLLVGMGLSQDEAEMPIRKVYTSTLAAAGLTYTALASDSSTSGLVQALPVAEVDLGNPFRPEDEHQFHQSLREAGIFELLFTCSLVQPPTFTLSELLYSPFDFHRQLAGPPPEASALIKLRLTRFVDLLSKMDPELTPRQMVRLCIHVACRPSVEFESDVDRVGGLIDGGGPSQPIGSPLHSPSPKFEAIADAACRKSFVELFLACAEALGQDLVGPDFEVVGELSGRTLDAWAAGSSPGQFRSATSADLAPGPPHPSLITPHLAEWHEVVASLKSRHAISMRMRTPQNVRPAAPPKAPPRRI